MRPSSAAFSRDARQFKEGLLSKTRLGGMRVSLKMRNVQAGYRLARSDEPYRGGDVMRRG